MVRMGLGDRPVWATAWGWNSLPGTWAGPSSPWPIVDPQRQVAYTVEALDVARREWPWMGPMIVYHYQPDRPPDDPRWGFALVDAQGESGPLYEALARYHASPQPHHAGVYLPRPENAQYSANAGDGWRFSAAGADPPHGADRAQRNAVIRFEVVGTALDLTVRRGDYWGVLYVTIDGRPANGLPRDEAGRSYLVLYDPAGRVETVRVARGLAAGTAHRVEIVAHGGWGQWPLAGWSVHRAQVLPRGSVLWPLAAGLVALAFAWGQIVADASLHRPLYAALGRLFGWYRSLPEWVPVLATLGAAVTLYVVPWTAPALVLLVLWTLLAFLRIDLGLATVALALPFAARPKVLLGRPFSVVELSLAGCAVAWLVARVLDWGRRTMGGGQRGTIGGRPLAWRAQAWLQEAQAWLARPGRSLGRRALDVGMAALALLALASVDGWAPRSAALRELRTVFLESAVFYALIRLAVHSPRARRRLVEGWLLGATLIAGVGLWQALAGRNLITAEGVWRVRGLYGSPNNLALYLERALPVLLAVAWRGTDRGVQAYGAAIMRLAYAGAAGIVLAALLLTFSKGALLLGVPASLLALGLLQRDRRATWVALGALALLALLLAPWLLTERFGSLLDVTRGTGFFRLKLWRSALRMIADHPLTGVGLDGYLYAYRSRYVLPSAWEELNLSHPHNLLLDAWTRLGALGVGVVGWLIVTFFRTAWARHSARGVQRALLLGLMASMVALLAHGLVDQALFTIDLAFVFGLLLAVVQQE
jgi:O-antigen ligase